MELKWVLGCRSLAHSFGWRWWKRRWCIWNQPSTSRQMSPPGGWLESRVVEREGERGGGVLREEGGWGKVGKRWLKGGGGLRREVWGGGEEGGEHGQTGDAHFTMTGWVGSREGKRGREGGRGDVEEGWWGGCMALFLQRTHKEEEWDG